MGRLQGMGQDKHDNLPILGNKTGNEGQAVIPEREGVDEGQS